MLFLKNTAFHESYRRCFESGSIWIFALILVSWILTRIGIQQQWLRQNITFYLAIPHRKLFKQPFLCLPMYAGLPDPHHFNAYPDPGFHLNEDPDPDSAFHPNVDPDPDPAPHRSDTNLQPLVYRPSRAPFWVSILSVPGLPWLYFEPLKLLNFDLNTDPDLAVPWNAIRILLQN